MSASRIPPQHMTETSLQQAVIELAMHSGWLVNHQRPARTAKGWRTAIEGHAGFPDLVLVHPRRHRALVFELKDARSKPDPEQERWLSAWGGVESVRSGLWKPADWTSGEIEELLVGG